MKVNRFNCGAENNAGMLKDNNERRSRDAERETCSHTELFPVIVCIVDCGVIALLLAADKPLEESGLHWILSGGCQTVSAGSTRQPEGFFGGFSSLSLQQQGDAECEEKAEAADRYQHLSVIICTCC